MVHRMCAPPLQHLTLSSASLGATYPHSHEILYSRRIRPAASWVKLCRPTCDRRRLNFSQGRHRSARFSCRGTLQYHRDYTGGATADEDRFTGAACCT